MTFFDKLDAAVEKNNSLLCVGLDPVLENIPSHLQDSETPLFDFCKAIVDATNDLVCAYKPNSAFFEAHGSDGFKQLEMLCEYMRKTYPEIPILLDAKRGDIGHTNEGYVTMAFDRLQADAITLHPYLGKESLAPFLNRNDKGLFILARTSNPGGGEFQDDMYEKVVRNIVASWNEHNNCAIVAGATYPEELKKLRQIAPDMVFLVPGVGSQGGDLEAVLENGRRKDGKGLIISSSRSVLYAGNDDNFAEAARGEAQQLAKKMSVL